MPDPISFETSSPRLDLPFLFVAQAQKEFFLNEALARLDALVHANVQGEANDPPANPVAGECWIVGAAPSGAWADRPGELACYQSGNWLFAAPQQGMRVYDKAAGQDARYDGGWIRAAPVAAPGGGSVQDAEARAAIAGLVAALVEGGILSAG